MRTFLTFIGAASLGFAGCATADQTAVPTGTNITPADSSAKPGSGPGAPPSSGMPLNTGLE